MAPRRLLALLFIAALLVGGCALVSAQADAQATDGAASGSPAGAPADAHDHADHEVGIAGEPAPEDHAHDEAHADAGQTGDHAHEPDSQTVEDHDHAAEDHAHEAGIAAEDHDHAAEDHAHVAGTAAEDHDHAAEDHDHAAEDHAHVAGTAAKEKDSHAGHLHGGGSCYFEGVENYNMGLHIGSVFILLGASMFGAFTPVLLHISSRNNTNVMIFIRLGTYFGFGTILSTAFIHMMLPAAEKLSSDCLPESWTGRYEAWAYLFVVIAILGMQLMDYCVEMAYTHYASKGVPASQLNGAIIHAHHGHKHLSSKQLTSAPTAPPPAPSTEEASEHGSRDEETGNAAVCPTHGKGCHPLLKDEIEHKADASQIVGIYLMEAGIVFHSVLIGLALGVTGGTSFTTLLIALSFHQCFEGFAIGSAAVDSGLGLKKSFLMGLIYSLTTPTGIAIGIGVHETFHRNSTTALMVEGILDAISTGILIYVVLVELLSPMMTQSKWLRAQRWWLQVLGFVALYAGAGVMAGIGKWV